MTIVIKKPILVAGISLTFLLWLGQYLTHYLSEIGNVTVLLIILLGGISVISSKITRKKEKGFSVSISEINITDIESKLAKLKTLIDTLIEEATTSKKIGYSQKNYNFLNDNLTKISNIIDRNDLHIGILNKRNNTLNINQLLNKKFTNIKISAIAHSLNDLDDFNSQQEELLLHHDLILMLVQGDLTESEKNLIKLIQNNQQKVLVLFDDIDFSLEEEKNLIWQNIKNRLQGIMPEEHIIKISTQQQKVKVIKYKDNLNYQEWEEISDVKYEQLIETFSQIINQKQEQLILLTAYRNALNLEEQIKEILNQIRKGKALVIMEKYQLIAATATFANPVSSLDLLATAAINTQMIVDVSKVYQQSLSVSQAQEISIALGKLMMKLGIVEISSQAVTNILKSNAFTFVAGGLIQAVSAAYLTRICGLSLVEYYQVAELNDSQGINLNTIKEKIQLIFKQNKDKNILTQFVQNTALLLKNS